MTAVRHDDAVTAFCRDVPADGEGLADAVRTVLAGRYDLDDVLRHGNLRTPRWALHGADPAAAIVTRRVANRDVTGCLDADAADQALDTGAVLALHRPDLLLGPQRPLTELLDAGRLELLDLVLRAHGRDVHLGGADTAVLVTQVSGTSEVDGRRLHPGDRRAVIGATTLSPTGAGLVRVLARRVPTGDDTRRAVTRAFLAHLDTTGASRLHHLVAPPARAGWLRAQWHAFRAAGVPITVDDTMPGPLAVTVAARAGSRA